MLTLINSVNTRPGRFQNNHYYEMKCEVILWIKQTKQMNPHSIGAGSRNDDYDF